MKVVSKQYNSDMCIICGLNNGSGIKAPFYNMEDGTVATRFQFRDIHQSYPGRVHGGLVTTMIDELAGRVLWVNHDDLLGVTMTLTTKFRKPIPYNVTLIGRGKMLSMTKHGFKAECSIINEETREVLASGEALYAILPFDKVMEDGSQEHAEWIMNPDDVTELDF